MLKKKLQSYLLFLAFATFSSIAFSRCNSTKDVKFIHPRIDSDGANLEAIVEVISETEIELFVKVVPWGEDFAKYDDSKMKANGDEYQYLIPDSQFLKGRVLQYQFTAVAGGTRYPSEIQIFRVPASGVIAPFTDLEMDMLYENEIVVDGLLDMDYITKDKVDNGVGVQLEDMVRGKMTYDDLFDAIRSEAGVDIITYTLSIPIDSLISAAKHIDESEGGIVIRNSYDVERAKRENKIGVILYVQKHFPIYGDANNVQKFYDAGLRMFQLHYGASVPWNTSPEERLGGAGLDELPIRMKHNNQNYDLGLTELGEKVVKKLNELHMIVDASHCHEKTLLDAIKISSSPVFTNHTNSEAISFLNPEFEEYYMGDHRKRNLNDEGIIEVARNGGLIGVMPVNVYLDTDGDGPDSDDLLAHIAHMTKIIDEAGLAAKGIDHLSFASDSPINGFPDYIRFYPGSELARTDRIKVFVKKMSEQKDENGEYIYSTDDLIKFLGKNAVKAYQSVLEGHTKPLIYNVRIENGISFSWTNSLSIGVEDPNYELFVYGIDDMNEETLIRQVNTLGDTTQIISLDEISLDNGVYSNYKWFVRARNNMGYTDSEMGYFTIDHTFSQVIN